MKIAIIDDYLEVAAKMADWNKLPQGSQLETFRKPFSGLDEAASKLRGFDVIVAMRERTPFPAELLQRLKELRLLVTTGMRNLSIDMKAAWNQGITVCGTRLLGYPAAELTWALILGLNKNLPAEVDSMRSGNWHVGLARGLNGKTLGIYGLGKLGSQVAKVGLAFRMRVIAWSTNLTRERCYEFGVDLVSRKDLFLESDILTVHVVLSERTRSSIGSQELGWMKPEAYLVNTSRGPVIKESDLLDALHQNGIAGAALDVYDEEPLPANHPFRNQKNLLLTGHTGYVTEENFRKGYVEALENILAWHSSRPVRVLNAQDSAT